MLSWQMSLTRAAGVRVLVGGVTNRGAAPARLRAKNPTLLSPSRTIGRFIERYSTSLYHVFFFSSRRRHTRFDCDWSSDVCSSDLALEITKLLNQRCALVTSEAAESWNGCYHVLP